MTGRSRDAATQRQIDAADPALSTWLSANAGSGKTKVLIDRVTRLLLQGCLPQNILCLTYTKAAASEMQNRLFDRLGDWAMFDDAKLTHALFEIGVDRSPLPDDLRVARRLFARAVEAPGGLKIQTIHSFCAALLRQFPIEAGLSPGFRELDEAETDRLMRQSLDDLASGKSDRFHAVAARIGDADLLPLAREISANRNAFTGGDAGFNSLLEGLGMSGTDTADALAARLFDDLSMVDLRGLEQAMASQGTKQAAEFAARLAPMLETSPTPSDVESLVGPLLTKDHRLSERLLSAKRREAIGTLWNAAETLAENAAKCLDRLRLLKVLESSRHLHDFARAFLDHYDRSKRMTASVDFDDLIRLALELLSHPSVGPWVAFRLDGRIEHILVDEAQDTNPTQWKIIEQIIHEFSAGQGRDTPHPRTIFVVGDPKQSIYSFQGADPHEYERVQPRMRAGIEQGGGSFQQLELEFSFRSATSVLSTVDQTIAASGTSIAATSARHRAFKADLPGRVDLWPHIDKAEKPEDAPWFDPVDRPSPKSHVAALAERIADQVRHMVDHGTLPPVPGTGDAKPIGEGDILILVQTRNQLFHEIIRTLKSRGLRVAGADVLKMGEELAVRDLLSLLHFVNTPADDLALATVLRSPLFGWGEAQLFHAAHDRDGATLWETLLHAPDRYHEVISVLSDLMGSADFLRPFELLMRALTRYEGRRRLVARLGIEASDGIDALLNQALEYERVEPASLTGFLARMAQSNVQIKRRPEGRGDKIRVMTVHGAKGLESPIVILPDTAEKLNTHRHSDHVLLDESGRAFLAPPAAEMPNHLKEMRGHEIERQQEEADRLLYVAMTRAEQWLIVASAGNLGKRGDTWAEQIGAGIRAAGGDTFQFPFGTGLRLNTGEWHEHSKAEIDSAPDAPTALPTWLKKPVATAPAPLNIHSPSDLGGAKVIDGPFAGAGGGILLGDMVHDLLETFPHGSDDFGAKAVAYIDGRYDAATAQEIETAVMQCTALYSDPSLAQLFEPEAMAEVPVVATVPDAGGIRIRGAIDRLILSRDRVQIIDFKTNAAVPERPEDVPEGILRQMGAYHAALRQIYPNHAIEAAILWTASCTLMPLPEALISAALARALP